MIATACLAKRGVNRRDHGEPRPARGPRAVPELTAMQRLERAIDIKRVLELELG
ncbi:MAG TPA: hypothetical protein VK586_08965 [Streptosporangiaceae bacterium]|nr:hypothetical protein [Streptosporangiaceae bacterium]